jgi:hypothetical protein
MKFAEKYFFRHYALDPALKCSLSEEAGLGAHGNVIVISRDNSGQWIERHYIWSHVASRPWGTEVSQQCPRCKRIRGWAKPKVVKTIDKSPDGTNSIQHTIQHSCRFCSYSKRFAKPADLVRDGVMAESGSGQWYFSRRVLARGIP